jgi:peptide/nickel transport system substrate-binding protein
LDPERSVAESWEVSEGNTVHTFHIREGITFHNGDDLTAEDVKFSLERIMREDSQSAYAGNLREQIASIEVPDPYTVVITTNSSSIFLEYDLSQLIGNEGVIVPKGYIEANGEEAFQQNPVGSGPYKFADFRADDHLTLVVNPDYWKFTPAYESVVFRIVPEEQTRSALLQRGEVDIISASPRKARELEAEGFTRLVKEGAYAVTVLLDQQWEPPFDDARVREALNIAIDRDGLNQSLFEGLATVTGNYSINSLDLGYKEQPLYEFDPERARQLLEEAGNPNPTIVAWSYERAGLPEAQRMMEAIASMWQDVGAEVEIRSSDYNTVRGLQQDDALPDGSVHPINAGGQTVGIGRLSSIFGSNALLSVTHDPRMDELIAEVAASEDVATYKRLMGEIADYIRENHISLPLYELGNVFMAQEHVGSWNFTTAAFSWDLLNLVERN